MKRHDRHGDHDAILAAAPPRIESPIQRLLDATARMRVPLEAAGAAHLVALLDRVALSPQNLIAVTATWDAVDRHLADSLAGLTVPEIRSASRLVDIGSGAGFPGLVLAISAPEIDVTLLEAERRKAQWLQRASADLTNVKAVHGRSEEVAKSAREEWDVATVRAVAELPAALELAAPLVAVGGSAVLWTGKRDRDSEIRAATAARDLGFDEGEVHPVAPVPGAERHLLVFRKRDPAPKRFPRRPGRATKRPLA